MSPWGFLMRVHQAASRIVLGKRLTDRTLADRQAADERLMALSRQTAQLEARLARIRGGAFVGSAAGDGGPGVADDGAPG